MRSKFNYEWNRLYIYKYKLDDLTKIFSVPDKFILTRKIKLHWDKEI